MANRFLNNITINDAYTFPDNDGSNGQAIVTDGAGNLTFGSVAAASAESTEAVHIPVKNTSGSQILKGTPVYITGETGNSGKIEIAPADASSASTMPCLGLLESTLNNNAEGFCVQGGLLEGLSTATIDGTSANANNTVYVKSGGGLTLTKPTGTGLIQNIAKVARPHASSGSLVVSAILRTNDVPNLPSGKIWVGDGNTTVSTVVFIDETNNYFGLNNVAPAQALDVTGNILASGSIEGNSIIKTGGVSTEFLKADGSVDSSTYLSSIPNSGVASGQYGDASNIPQITIGADGRITSATDVAVNIPAGTTIGTAGNEVSGTVTLAGSGDTTLTQAGNLITISSTSSGGGGGAELSIERNVFTATANQTAFTISSDITASSNTQVYIDGVYQAKSNYTTSGSVITFSTGVPAGAEVEVVHFISVLSKVYTDTFTGDASTVDFTASKDVSDENVTQVYIDGVYQSKDNYTTSGTTITFSTAPPIGSAIEVVHFTPATYSTLNSNQFTGTGSQTDFTLTQGVTVDNSFVFIQGVYQEKSTYSITGTTLAFTTAPLNGYTIEVITFGVIANVTSSPVNSVNSLTGSLNIIGGDDINISAIGTDITINSEAVSTLNSLTGSLSIIGGNNITVTPSGSNITIDSNVSTSYSVSVISTNTTAVANTLYVLTANLTLTLPASPSNGDSIKVSNRSSVATCIIARNGENIMGDALDLTIDKLNSGFEMIYSGSAEGWILIGVEGTAA